MNFNRALAAGCGLTLYLALACPLPAMAEKADASQPVTLDADRVTIDDATRISHYDGSVVLTQGTMRISAAHLEIKQNDSGIASAEATGSPVQFRQRMDPKNGQVTWAQGSALRIDYDAVRKQVEMYGQAWIKNGGDEVRGDHISYNIGNGDFQVQGAAGQGGAPGGRVHAVIQPRSKPGKTAAAPAP